MSAKLSRRRMLTILGAGTALSGSVFGLRSLQSAPVPSAWHGEVLGALSSMTLWHPRRDHAERTLARMLTEVDRLDRIFSLYREDSELVQLNREGRLERASRDLVAVSEASLTFAAQSGGAFDPTIQPLWDFYAAQSQRSQAGYDFGDAANGASTELKAFSPAARKVPASHELDAVLARVGYAGLDLAGARIAFARPGMGLSLNGIAQGYITDRITDLLANEGFEQAMIELGETRALGSGPKAPFEVGIVDPAAPGQIARNVALANEALAVSGGYGMRLAGGHHIFNPVTGHSPTRLTQVAVFAARASTADALSTAIYVSGPEAAPKLLAQNAGARAIMWKDDGSVIEA